MRKITIIVTGERGTGKTRICMAIEEHLKKYGFEVEFTDLDTNPEFLSSIKENLPETLETISKKTAIVIKENNWNPI